MFVVVDIVQGLVGYVFVFVVVYVVGQVQCSGSLVVGIEEVVIIFVFYVDGVVICGVGQ